MAVKKKAPAKKAAPPPVGPRRSAADRVVAAMRDLGYIELVDAVLVAELEVLASDLDDMSADFHLYPQVVRLYHDIEERICGRLLPSADGDDGKLSLADRVAALGNAAD